MTDRSVSNSNFTTSGDPNKAWAGPLIEMTPLFEPSHSGYLSLVSGASQRLQPPCKPPEDFGQLNTTGRARTGAERITMGHSSHVVEMITTVQPFSTIQQYLSRSSRSTLSRGSTSV